MNKESAMSDLLDTQQAADWLAENDPRELKRSAADWLTYLKGNRVRTRTVAYRIPYTKIAARNLYAVAELHKFISAERMRIDGRYDMHTVKAMQAFELGMLNRKWEGNGRIYGQFDDATKTPFVKLAIDNPLQTFRMSIDEAIEFFKEVGHAISHAEAMADERITGNQQISKKTTRNEESTNDDV